jgi:hypothetical protein
MAPNSDLLEAVEAELLPRIAGLPLTVVDHSEGSSFDLASVTLQGGNVRVTLQRERGPIHTGLAAATTPHEAFDSFVVLEYLGLSSQQGLTGSDVHIVLDGIAKFLMATWVDLNAALAPPLAPSTNEKLSAIRKARAKVRWG